MLLGGLTWRHVSPLRAAIIGYGLAGSVFHAPLISATPGMVVAAVVTGNPSRQEQVAAEVPDAAVLADSDEIWERAEDFDLVVVVAAPNRVHARLAEASMRAGVPAVVDKPLATSVDDARRLASLSQETGVLLSVFHNRRWDNDFLTVRRLLEEGQLGQVLRFESRFERYRPEVAERWREPGARGRRRPPLRPRQPPDRSGAGAVRGPVARVRRGRVPASRGRGGPTTPSWRCAFPPGRSPISGRAPWSTGRLRGSG